MNDAGKTAGRWGRRSAWAAVAVLLVYIVAPADGEVSFDDKREAMSLSTATQPEKAVVELLDAGLAEHKPTQAIAVAQKWLRENVAKQPLLLYKAGRAAELSGDWKSAAVLYQQYLKRADLKSQTASDAVLGVYTLLLNQVADTESAYAYSKSEGHRLSANAQARQFDRWFLDEAKRRKDHEAVAERLLSLVKAKVSDDLLVALYEQDFVWLLNAVRVARLDQERFSKGFVQTVKDLAKADVYDTEYRLVLDAEVSIKAFNMALLAGDQAEPPLSEAKALLSRYPRYAKHILTCWTGGTGRHYRGDPRKYWPIALDTKLAQIKAAGSKLSEAGQDRLYQSWGTDYFSGQPQIVPADKAMAWALANPKRVNRKAAPVMSFNWNKLSSDDAAKLAPLLKFNPSPEAALVRAMAEAGADKNLDKAVDTLLTNESWRLGTRELDGRYIDQLWHWAGRPGGNAKRDQLIARGKALAKQIRDSDLKKEAPAAKRLGAFKKLWQDYRSAQPKIPAVRERLMGVLKVTPEALPELLKEDSTEAQMLVRQVLGAGIHSTDSAWRAYETASRIYTGRYSPCFDEQVRRHYGGLSRLVNNKEKYRPHPLEPTLRKLLDQQIKQGKVEPWLVFAWLNTQFPEDNSDCVALMKKLAQSPAWKSLPFEARAGARRWFKSAAMTKARSAYLAASQAELICKPLTEMPKDADAAATAAALKQTLEGLKASPVRHDVLGLERLGQLKPTVLSDPKVFALIVELVGPMRCFTTDSRFGQALVSIVQKDPQPGLVHVVAPYLWRHTEVHHRTLQQLIALSQSLADKHPSAGSALARCGLQAIARHKRGHTYYKRESDIPALTSARGKAALAMGLIDIPVPKNDPAYGIYRSQAEFVIGNEDSARELFTDHADQLLAVHRKMSVSYLLWALQALIDSRDEAGQEALAKALMEWMQESETAFSLEQRVTLEIAYGDIALQRGMLPEAHKIFARIGSKPEYQSVYKRHTATLRRVLVERISGDYGAALSTLSKLEKEKIPRLTTEVFYSRAEVYYAQKQYEDSAEQIVKVLDRDPDHADAKILRGRVQLKLQRLIEATEVELGSSKDKDTIVPGEKLKVTLNDPTLTVSSGGTDIEVVVETTSGDKEYLLLRQFGDQKTKYRGDVETALGKPEIDDGVLQLVGDDKITYAYSERYRKKMPNLEENRGGPITVASDAVMMASARKLLSENEQRLEDMRAATEALKIRQRGVSLANTDPKVIAELKAEAAARARRAAIEARVKPGNPIYLRVIDPDRGRTDAVDELAVNVSSSSGDLVGRVVLKETGTHTGTFEGSVQTASAQAIAFGSSTEPGRNPNTVLSPKADYPAWRPVVSTDDETPHSLTVDLNDNAELGKLDIVANDDGFALKRFLVQTAMDGKAWTTVASYPNAQMAVDQPWRPSVSVVMEEGLRAPRGARSVYELAEVRRHMQTGWLKTPDMAFATNVKGPSEMLPASVTAEKKWAWQGRHNNPAVMVRFRAYFYEPMQVSRRFGLSLGKHTAEGKKKSNKKKLKQPEFLIAVNGRVITSKDDGKLEGQINLKPGLHMVEVWATGWVDAFGFGRSVKLRGNISATGAMVDCPDAMFDPSNFPKGVLDHRNAGATLKAADNGKSFAVGFAQGSRTRLLRLVFVEHDGPVPSINRLKLTGKGGAVLLPVKQDFAQLRKNDQLEIITGDRVTVRYVDDRYVTRGRQKHERFLNVAFTDGKAGFADVEPRYSNRHRKKMPYHERILRFVHGKPLSVVVDDADMDVSVKPDKLALKVVSSDGGERELVAEETGPSTGVFRAWVTPVAGTAGDGEIKVAVGGALTVVYRDAENLSPGVPYDRVASINHAQVKAPRIEIAHAEVAAWEPVANPDEKPRSYMQSLNERLDPWHTWSPEINRRDYNDQIKARFKITKSLLTEGEAPKSGLQLVHGRHALIEIVAPHLALGASSKVDVYVQTDRGRKAAGRAGGSTFDLSVPGTLRFVAVMGKMQRTQTPQRGGYVETFATNRGNDYERTRRSLTDGRFRVVVPLVTGPLPKISYADPTDIREKKLSYPTGLAVKAGERIHLGIAYNDPSGKRQWATTSARVITRPMLDAMQEDYREPVTTAHVGEKLHLRVVDLAADKTEARDLVRVLMASKSGQKHYVTLTETNAFSGVFKGVYQLTYATKKEGAAGKKAAQGADYDVKKLGFPVIYGDTVGVRYTDPKGQSTPVQYIQIAKGSDGTIAPFSKQYSDDKTAMQTQFAMAECFLELARRHRKLGEEEQASREFDRARQLLQKTIAQFKDPETRAHAQYLLGNLTMEDAEAATDKEIGKRRFQAALARYMKVTSNYPGTPYAAKAQFKIAVLYEKLGEPDIAAQEYVKLAYKHPESEHLATAMARLGTHFQRKAVAFDKKAKPLLQEEDDDKQLEGEVFQKRAKQEYVKAGQIFERLQSRFPTHSLAGKAGVRSGQLYMRAEDYRAAIKAFKAVIADEGYDGATLRAESMYWAGRCYETQKKQLEAYAMYKRITYDFPESKWAAYARAQLSSDQMIRLDDKLEKERLEAGQ